MLSIAGQTAGPSGLKFFVDTHGLSGGVMGYKKIVIFFSQFFLSFYLNFFSTGNAGSSASTLYKLTVVYRKQKCK